jgi:hypothetical protein
VIKVRLELAVLLREFSWWRDGGWIWFFVRCLFKYNIVLFYRCFLLGPLFWFCYA